MSQRRGHFLRKAGVEGRRAARLEFWNNFVFDGTTSPVPRQREVHELFVWGDWAEPNVKWPRAFEREVARAVGVAYRTEWARMLTRFRRKSRTLLAECVAHLERCEPWLPPHRAVHAVCAVHRLTARRA